MPEEIHIPRIAQSCGDRFTAYQRVSDRSVRVATPRDKLRERGVIDECRVLRGMEMAVMIHRTRD